jgi:tetratricopeptide (TPR) repeat protein
VTCYEQALAAVARMPADQGAQELTCDLHFRMARVLYTTGDFARSRVKFAEAAAAAEALGDDRRQASILGGLCYLLGSEGQHAEAIESGDLALSIARSQGDTGLQIWTSVALGRQHFALGTYAQGRRLQEALSVLERASGEASAINLRYGEAMVPGMLAHVDLLAGHHDRAEHLADQALAIARARGERGDEAWALHLMGSVAAARIPRMPPAPRGRCARPSTWAARSPCARWLRAAGSPSAGFSWPWAAGTPRGPSSPWPRTSSGGCA